MAFTIHQPHPHLFAPVQPDRILSRFLKSEIGHGATGEVLRGTLEVEASECPLLDVAVKLALTSERDALRNEYKIYHQLRSSGVTAGITTPLGLFDDVEGGACALVMPYVGIPLAAKPELVLPISYQCIVILYHSYPHLLTRSKQGSRSYNFGGNT
jgi:hypothetical protein